jgi:hypothetical protein
MGGCSAPQLCPAAIVSGKERPRATLGSDTVAGTETAGVDAWVTSTVLTLQPRWLGALMVLTDGSGTESGPYRVLDIDETGRALLEGAAGVSAVELRGEYHLDHIDLLHGAQVTATDSFHGDTIDLYGTAALPAVVHARNLTVRSGASHGGAGIKGNNAGESGDTYGSVYQPQLGGGGGSWQVAHPGGDGGGALVLSVETLVLDGEIRAHGQDRMKDVVGAWSS